MAEKIYETQERLKGNELKRSPHGRNYINTHRDSITRQYLKTTHDEVKGSSTAPESRLQKKGEEKNRPSI